MANKSKESTEMSMPIVGMLLVGGLSVVVVAASFYIEPFWPLPQGMMPYFGWETGAVWGLVVGAVMGLAVGFIADESHYKDSTY